MAIGILFRGSKLGGSDATNLHPAYGIPQVGTRRIPIYTADLFQTAACSAPQSFKSGPPRALSDPPYSTPSDASIVYKAFPLRSDGIKEPLHSCFPLTQLSTDWEVSSFLAEYLTCSFFFFLPLLNLAVIETSYTPTLCDTAANIRMPLPMV